jgi:hypothetical protein
VASAGFALFLDVHHFPTGRDLAVLTDDAAASQGRETEKPNETHHLSTFLRITLSNIRT